MVSAEVQRTLVKSPPELWSELSDPAALARHLGELGEIRITRADPEKRVEWEAEKASGTVAIRPSGWGTRVTLTLRREFAEQDAGRDAGEAPGQPAGGDEAPATAADRDLPAAVAGGLPTGADGALPAAADGALPAESDGAVAAEADRALPAEADAALPAAAEQPDPVAHEWLDPPAEQAELAADELSAPSPGEPDGTDGGEDGSELEAAQPARRSFWSRLFGRRFAGRRAAPEIQPPGELAGEAGSDPAGVHLPRPATAAAQAAHLDLGQEEPDVAEAGAQPYMAAAHDTGSVQQAPAPHAGAGASAGADPPMVPAQDAAAQPQAPADPHTVAEPDPPAEMAPAGEDEERDPAEAAAVEQATALLSGVLDRLGAAHHRPFSRP